jgi:hypothetical protein
MVIDGQASHALPHGGFREAANCYIRYNMLIFMAHAKGFEAVPPHFWGGANETGTSGRMARDPKKREEATTAASAKRSEIHQAVHTAFLSIAPLRMRIT